MLQGPGAHVALIAGVVGLPTTVLLASILSLAPKLPGYGDFFLHPILMTAAFGA